MSPALRLSLGPRSRAVEPRSMMISPSGTGAVEGWYVVAASARALRGCAGAGGLGAGVGAGRHAATPTGGWCARRCTASGAAAEAAATGGRPP